MLITSWKCGARCRTAGKPLVKLSENRWKTAGKTAGKLPETTGKTAVELPENRWKTAGKLPAKPLENCRRPLAKPLLSCRKTVGKPLENRWKTAGKLPETTGKIAVEPPENRWETAGKTGVEPLENRRKAAGGPLAKTVGKPLKTAGKSPVFGSLLPVSIRAGNGWEGSLRRHFSAFGGGCHKGPTFQAQLMYFSKRWGWWNGDLRVFRRDEGSSRSDDAKIGISL